MNRFRFNFLSARTILVLFLVAVTSIPATRLRAQAAQAGESLFGRNDYVEYQIGDLPLILVSGHGGALRPEEIATRTWGVTVADTNTRQLTIVIAEEITARTGRYPHVIINHLHRSKLDPNREIVEAAQGDPYAEITWHEFHGFIEQAREAAAAEFGFGFMIDVHGHAHNVQRVELGYAMSRTQLNVSDATLEEPGRSWNNSLRTLLLARPGKSFPDLLRGPSSFGDLLNLHGIPAWPSPEFPSPGDEPFFSGGYITRRHGPMNDNGVINAVQAEFYYSGLRNTAANRARTARVFADSLQKYFWDNYQFSLGTGPLYRLEALETEVRKGDPLLYFNVLREGDLSAATAVDLEVGGTAARNIDYRISAQTISFPSGQSVRQHWIQPMGPSAASGDKTIEIRLKPDRTQAADPTPLVITLGDGMSSAVRVEALTREVFERDQTVEFRVWRTGTDLPLTVGLEWTGTARPGIDYRDGEKLPEFISFASGESEQMISLKLIDNSMIDRLREIVLRLFPGDAYTVGYPSEATVFLHDDDASSGLAVWYRGDVAENRIRDFSGNDRHATTLPAGRGPISVETEVGNAISFDGIEGVAAIPEFALEGNGGFAIAFSFRLDPENLDSEQTILSFGQRGTPGSLNVSLESNFLRTSAVNASGAFMVQQAVGSWATGEWHHYALSFDSDGSLRIFLNGELFRSISGWNEPLVSDHLFWLGWMPETGSAYAPFAGELKDFRIYERAIADFEVAALASERMNFETWRKAQNLSDAAEPESDLNGKGLPLLLEYALGGVPISGFGLPRYEWDLADGRALIRFLHYGNAGDLHWAVEATDSLTGSWEIVAERLSGSENWSAKEGAALVEEGNLITVFDLESAAGSPKRFLRLRVHLSEVHLNQN